MRGDSGMVAEGIAEEERGGGKEGEEEEEKGKRRRGHHLGVALKEKRSKSNSLTTLPLRGGRIFLHGIPLLRASFIKEKLPHCATLCIGWIGLGWAGAQ